MPQQLFSTDIQGKSFLRNSKGEKSTNIYFVWGAESWVCETVRLMLKNIIQHSPTNNFFRKFVLDLQPCHRVGASESDFLLKGVIEILSSKVKLRKFEFPRR